MNTTVDALFPPPTGIVSLRNAIATANVSMTPTTITFDPSVFGTPQTIVVNGTGFVINGEPTTITGPLSAVTINGNGQGTVFQVNGATVALSGLSVTNGGNGGISNSGSLTLMNVVVSGNSGSGIHNSGTASLSNVSVLNNTLPTFEGQGGAGVYNAGAFTAANSIISGNMSSGNGDSGGGIYNFDGTVSLTNVSLTNNSAAYDGGAFLNAGHATLKNVTVSNNMASNYGAGIDNGAGPMTLANCTIAGNHTTSDGGGIYNGGISISGPGGSFNTGTLTITNTTIANNAAANGGGVFNVPASTVMTSNSILAGNTLVGPGGSGPDAAGSLNSLGYNLVGESDGSVTSWNSLDITGTAASPVSAMLLPLGNYGGGILTMPPKLGSPTINAGFNGFALDGNFNPLTTDERGYSRIYGGTVDLGAAEFQPLTINLTAANNNLTLEQSADHSAIDWTLGASSGQQALSDSEGMLINGSGGSDTITLLDDNGGPLPAALHLNGTFTINGLSASNPLANTNLEIGKSTVYITYANPASDPLATIRDYLQIGYNSGLWTGSPTSSTGVITSAAAAGNASKNTGIGYADSAEGLVALAANTVELKYTLYGDTGLTGSVTFTDFMRMTQHYTLTGQTWSKGDFNYDGAVDSNDFNLLQPNYGQTLPAAAPVMAPIVVAPATSTPPSNAGDPLPVSSAGVVDPTAPVKLKKHGKKGHAGKNR